MEILKKERIKDRMLKTAARIWGVPENEIEANYDPLVLLMIEACAAEFEKIGYDLQSSQSRLLDRLSDLIFPEALSGPKPPSAIMQALPLDGQMIINASHKFFCNQRITGNQKAINTDIHFTPIGKFPLLNVSLKNILISDRLYAVKENGTKESVFEKSTNDSNDVFEIELALAVDKSLTSLNGLSIFFDLRTHSEAHSFYKNLEAGKAFINNDPVKTQSGYALTDQFDLDPGAMILEGNDYSHKISRLIAGAYRPQFLHIADSREVSSMISSTPPDSWKQIIPAEILQKDFATPMVYLKLSLSRPYPRYVLESLMVSINAFPVISRKYNSINYRTNEWINIIPLQIEGAFLDLHDVSGPSGKYRFHTSSQTQDLNAGEATVRNSGAGKTNSREVREIVNSLMQAIRDESAYFSDINNDFILNRLREINQILTRLQDQLANSKDLQEQHSYILLKPKQAGEPLSIQYWTTNVANAKQVKAYTAVSSLEHVSVNPKSSHIITAVTGGKADVTEADKKNYLRQQIASKGKIISVEDVKLLAVELFGSNLRKVEVNKTIQAGVGANKGFMRIIEVSVSLTEEAKGINLTEMQYLVMEMEYLLSENASPVYPYAVKIV